MPETKYGEILDDPEFERMKKEIRADLSDEYAFILSGSRDYMRVDEATDFIATKVRALKATEVDRLGDAHDEIRRLKEEQKTAGPTKAAVVQSLIRWSFGTIILLGGFLYLAALRGVL